MTPFADPGLADRNVLAELCTCTAVSFLVSLCSGQLQVPGERGCTACFCSHSAYRLPRLSLGIKSSGAAAGGRRIVSASPSDGKLASPELSRNVAFCHVGELN